MRKAIVLLEFKILTIGYHNLMVAKRCKYFATFSSNGLKLALFTLIWICSPHLNAIDDEDDEDSCKYLPQHPRTPVSLKLKSSKPF
jgi:hypothetical protein